MVDFLAVVVAFGAAVGLADLMWQRARHLQRNRMSRHELVDEAKDSEGDPHAKGERRRRGQEIALNRMLRDVAWADVVIVNPTHYAVALKWRRGDRHASICLAKGVDEIAARIRERAALAGVPLHSDPPTARALHATVLVDHLHQPVGDGRLQLGEEAREVGVLRVLGDDGREVRVGSVGSGTA